MNLDNPKLTAYALGELTDPAELSEVETWLAENSEGQIFVADTRQLADFLSEKLHTAIPMELTETQRETILTSGKIITLPKARRMWSMLGLAALAACLAAAPLLPWTELLRLRDNSAPTVAMNEKPMTLQMPVEVKQERPDFKWDATPLSKQLAGTETDAASVPFSASLQVAPSAVIAMNKTKSDDGTVIAGGAGHSQPSDQALAGADKNFRDEAVNPEAYDAVTENNFLAARDNPLSTFPIEVDTVSYANVRRMLNAGQLPTKGAVRVEEMLNYFTYDYAKPEGDAPFSTNLEVATCPWQPEHRLVRIGLKGRELRVQMSGTLVPIAKDVKIQVEFNPAVVSNYRLVGYENRALKKEHFADTQKDAGEIGAGHTVTALYEVVLVGSMSTEVHAEPLRYQSNTIQMKMATLPSGKMLTVKIRYKEPTGNISQLLEFPLTDDHKQLDAASRDFQFASAIAEFAELLRKSKHSHLASWESLIARASESKGEDRGGYRAEFVELAKKAEALTRRNDS